MSTKKIKGNKLRPFLISLCVIVSLVVIIALMVFSTSQIHHTPDQSDDQNSNQTDDTDEEPVADYNVLHPLNSQGVIDFINKRYTGFLYAGRPSCPHCRAFAPILTQVVKDNNLIVYYYNTDAANVDPELKSEALAIIDTRSVPQFMFIRDGEIIARLDDTTNEFALLEFIRQYL